MMTAPGSLLPVAVDAVAVASDLVRTHLPGLLTAKGDRDMATEVDYAVEHAVRDFLRDKTPDIAFLGEEEGATGARNSELWWALDPIDGTANFIHGLPLCGISLGLIHQARPIVGVIDLPFLDTRYAAAEHTGAYIGDRRIHTRSTSTLREAIVATGDYAVGDNSQQRNRLRLALTTRLAEEVQRVRMLGSVATDLAWLAEGKLDASLTLSNKPWDTAAGVIIAREAGAIVTDTNGTDHTIHSTATIAAAPGIAKQIAALIADITAEPQQH